VIKAGSQMVLPSLFDLFEDVGFPFSPDASLFTPASGAPQKYRYISESA